MDSVVCPIWSEHSGGRVSPAGYGQLPSGICRDLMYIAAASVFRSGFVIFGVKSDQHVCENVRVEGVDRRASAGVTLMQ